MAVEKDSNILLNSKIFSNALCASQWLVFRMQNLNVLHSPRVESWHAVKSGVSNGVGCHLFRKSRQSILHITRFPYRETFEVFNQFHKTLFPSQ
jgi:hypothetical protein